MNEAGKFSFQVVMLALCLAMAALVTILFMTKPYGLAVSWDAVCYYQAAMSFSMGDGFGNYSRNAAFSPMIYWPPLYPAALALGRFLGMAIEPWSRLMNSFLFGFNVFVIAMLAFYITGRRLALLAAGGLALVYVQFVELHAAALSEPLFFAFLFPALWALMRYAETGQMRFLAAAGLLSGLCMMTRYAGFSIVAAGVIVVLLDLGHGRPRGKALMLFLATALPLPVAWILRNLSMTGRPVGFKPGFFPDALNGLFHALDLFFRHFFPASWPLALRGWLVLFAIIVAFIVIRQFLRGMHAQPRGLRLMTALKVSGIFAATYAFTVVAGVFLSNKEVPLEVRNLLPLTMAMIPIIPCLLCLDPRAKIRKWGMAIFILFAVSMALRTVQLGVRMYRDGNGYSSRAWTTSALARTVKTLRDDVPVYSNECNAFYLYTGRPARQIPLLWMDPSGFFNAADAQTLFISKGAVAVIFHANRFAPHPVWWDLVRSVPLVAAFRDDWGVILVAPKRSPEVR